MNSKSLLFPTSPARNLNMSSLGSISPSKIRHTSNSMASRFRSPLKTPYFLPTSSLLPSASSPNKQPLACHNVVKRRRGNSVRRTLFGKPDPVETSNWLDGNYLFFVFKIDTKEYFFKQNCFDKI